MTPLLREVAMVFITNAVFLVVNMYLFHWRGRHAKLEQETLMREQHRQMYEEFRKRHGINGEPLPTR